LEYFYGERHRLASRKRHGMQLGNEARPTIGKQRNGSFLVVTRIATSSPTRADLTGVSTCLAGASAFDPRSRWAGVPSLYV
jgi:hypothetical protein